MHKADYPKFSATLDGICSLLSRGNYRPNETSTALFFKFLDRYELPTVLAALDAHCRDEQRGKFPPVPADVIFQIDQMAPSDGRPSADEAWPIALTASDENRTLVWTDEMAQAWGIARPVVEAGDEVGARMAFRAAYNRLVEEARQLKTPAKWTPSIGHDKSQRDAVLRVAVEQGKIGHEFRPQPPAVGLLEMSAPNGMPASAREKLLALRHEFAMNAAARREATKNEPV